MNPPQPQPRQSGWSPFPGHPKDWHDGYLAGFEQGWQYMLALWRQQATPDDAETHTRFVTDTLREASEESGQADV